MIYLASDHVGFELKEKLKTYLQELGYGVKDFGAFKFDAEDDYPDFIRKAAEAVANDPEQGQGIILGGSGHGEAMVANRFKRVRAAVYYGGDEKIITLSREHNNANVLSLGARFLTEEEAKKAVKLWLETKFNNEERHVRRIRKIDEL
ncbi:MAG: ribose-5-phosphate isomerase [Candidatus Sungbacteria bacterium RIFCSPLOWO2_12_FULL_41_11]|uniref:Ribose-5-phosphate isomerase n=1 Tax=Candidatus Sungbacteria bacterium RIFCSPLOWO2_12_FULL_41_11 TaxID=1802286 RepID=A0A1G2LMX9_9BACT|nr:MAG: Ribose-5-phosphate isomerase B [Parcubacteria group bacterium GW2011_GWA2_42_14]OGZ99455.1 MAG: ribose-5-phosphate isomerase [Candidatus Sungbacteria bacterium RIFCSPHIGHO2_02_FULL_41_12b]OHA12975.1 MAG: ribose-5-phosphate isomerase [Candidatus Sungbacteria bacterium RIFCSPLOWO2_12_FULL_41_11]